MRAETSQCKTGVKNVPRIYPYPPLYLSGGAHRDRSGNVASILIGSRKLEAGKRMVRLKYSLFFFAAASELA